MYDFKAPLIMALAITNKCNLKCEHCISNSGDEVANCLSFEEIKDILDQAANMKVPYFGFTGGEPFCREDFYDILEYASKKNFKIIITSNGSLITREWAKKLKKLNIYLMRISLDGSTSEKHDYFRGVKGAYSKTTEAISILAEEGISTTVLTTVSKYNYDDITNIIDLSVTLGANAYNTSLFYPAGRGAKRAGWVLSKEEYKEFYQSLTAKKEQYRGKIDIKAEEPWSALLDIDKNYKSRVCPAGIISMEIDAQGYALPCLCYFIEEPFNNIRNNTLSTIWRDSKLFKILRNRNKLKGKCSECDKIDICGGGCRYIAYLQKGDLLDEDPLCWIEKGSFK